MNRQWGQLPERGSAWTLRLILWIALHIGRPAGRALLYPITLYFLMTAGEARRGSQLFLRRALNREPSWRDRFRHIHCFAATILDRVYFLSGRLEHFEIEIVGGQSIFDQAATGRGCILLGSHLGSFEALRVIGLHLQRLPIRILMNTRHNPVMTRLLDALNPTLAQTIIPVGGPETLLKVQESVGQGYLVGALGDRIAPGERAAPCRFFGEDIALPIAPILSAALVGCPVILCFGLYRGGNRYQMHFELLAERVILDRRHRQEQLGVWMQRYADRLEHYARDAPYNWFNFYDYWQEAPSSLVGAERSRATGQSPRRFVRQFAMGWDGLGTLLLSNMLLMATLGLSGLWLFHRVWRMAQDTPAQVAESGWVVVLGVRLQRDQVSRDYACRLERAAALYRADPQRRILLVGGPTSGSVSEAERGRQFLLAMGLPTGALSIEDQSLHTLDNLRRTRQLLGEVQRQSFVLVTSRYHLARSEILARGLDLHPVLCAAEDRLRLDFSVLWRLALEAGYLHWYKVGRAWSRWTRNRHSLARIS
ncbi:MAG: YdcF family protein [Gammaproteobacteria bacterium]|nr:YdcF family protein [Gammaproteobacteria bacterium]MCP5198356.1 YdcF family protein [Gammaproteobacteria bacterium]